MLNDNQVDTPVDTNSPEDPTADYAESFDRGELVPYPASPYPDADLTQEEQKSLKKLIDDLGHIDVAARRWEVTQAWKARLMTRGYQYLWPRRGGGWIYIPFATEGQHGRGGYALYGKETNILATYQEIITAALTRDIPGVRFEPQNPNSDVDLTAKDAATNYARVFARNNDLLELHQQLAYYLCVDGRALIVTDHILDAQKFGRCEPDEPELVPETEGDVAQPAIYIVRHGETDLNRDDKQRGHSDVTINDKGERQMDRAGDWLKDKGIRLIVASPIERALDSASLIAQKINAPIEVDDRLASLDIGSLAGQESDEDVEEAFDENHDQPIAGGESPEDFENRVQAAVMEWVEAPDKPIAFVAHDSVISQIFKMFQGEDVPPGSNTEPGWIAALTPNQDGTLKPSVIWPVNPPETSVGEQRGKPRGEEQAKVYGKLEHKIPFSAGATGKLEDCPWAQVSYEVDVAWAKAMAPDKADKIRTGGAGEGENELDRIARINATLALEASYVTGDSMVRDCTVQRTWIRPAYYMTIEDKEIRKSIWQKMPDGCHALQLGGEFIRARNECMDDHLTLVHALPGSGINRLALCSKIVSVNERLNNWMDLLDAFFVKCIPLRWVDQSIIDVNALQNQPQEPGSFAPFLGDNLAPGKTLDQVIWMEPYPTAQPLMGDFIKYFIGELSQLLSHATPTLFGSESNMDSAKGYAMQRDQALEANSTPWHFIQVATASYFKQAVQLAARCRTEAVSGTDKTGGEIRIELVELKGNILCYPESDANFPESWIQKRSLWVQMLQDANNALFQRLMTSIGNRKAAIEAIGLEGLADPDVASDEKQMGEFEILLKTPPVQNPEYLQAQAALQESAQQIQANQSAGVMAQPQELQAVQQMEQQIATIPQLISSVRVKDTDNHAVEAEACLVKINSADGRKLASGTQQERLYFQNLTLHWSEHMAKVKPNATIKDLPKGFSAPIDKLPPDVAATVLTSVGAETKGPDVVLTKEFNAELKKSSKVTGPPVPGMGQ